MNDSSAADALLVASRVLVAVAARSIASVDTDVTLPQYRALVVLHTRGPQNAGVFSEILGIHPSTATRLCDRLIAKRLVRRSPSPNSGREVILSLTKRGDSLVRHVTDIRRAEIERIVERVPARTRPSIVTALTAFGRAAGEIIDEGDAPLGWS
ncbi:MAG: MarR family transcriptional regulator [Acidimicrobiales bacterium]